MHMLALVMQSWHFALKTHLSHVLAGRFSVLHTVITLKTTYCHYLNVWLVYRWRWSKRPTCREKLRLNTTMMMKMVRKSMPLLLEMWVTTSTSWPIRWRTQICFYTHCHCVRCLDYITLFPSPVHLSCIDCLPISIHVIIWVRGSVM